MRARGSWLSRGYLGLILIFLYLPICVVVLYSFNNSKTTVVWAGFTLDWYRRLLTNTRILEPLRNSLILAGFSCSIAAVVGTLGALGLSRMRFRAMGLLESVSSLPIMIPEITLGMAFLVFFAALSLPFGMLTLVLAHSTFCIPYVMLLVRTRLVGIDPSLEEAARDLGASGPRAFLTVTLPLLAPALISGILLAFAMSLDDVVISFFVTGPETNTLPVYVYGKLKTTVTPDINALCTLMLGCTVLAIAVSQLFSARDRQKTPRDAEG